MKQFLTCVMMAFVSAATAHAQSAITGKWQGKTPNGFQVELNLTAAQTALTGTFARDGQASDIFDGKVSQNAFAFKTTFNGQTRAFTGEIHEDQIRVWMDQPGPSAAAILKRVGKGKTRDDERLAGKWQGTTASGRPFALTLEIEGKQLTGRLTLAQQSTEIREGRVEGQAFWLAAGPLDGQAVRCHGRLVGEDLELTVEGVGSPLTLKRVN